MAGVAAGWLWLWVVDGVSHGVVLMLVEVIVIIIVVVMPSWCGGQQGQHVADNRNHSPKSGQGQAL